MTLPISTDIIRNTIGYLNIEISAISNYLNTIDSVKSSIEDKATAEVQVKKFIQNIGKLCKTVEEKTGFIMPIKGYTNIELKAKGLI